MNKKKMIEFLCDFSQYVIEQADCKDFESSSGKKSIIFLNKIMTQYSKKRKISKKTAKELAATNTVNMVTALLLKSMFQKGYISLVKINNAYGYSFTETGIKEMDLATKGNPELQSAIRSIEERAVRREVC